MYAGRKAYTPGRNAEARTQAGTQTRKNCPFQEGRRVGMIVSGCERSGVRQRGCIVDQVSFADGFGEKTNLSSGFADLGTKIEANY